MKPSDRKQVGDLYGKVKRLGHSSKTIISVKVPIKWESMTERQRTRLSRITGRDTRVIRAFLGVIARREDELIVGKRKKRISGAKLEKLTLTAKRFKKESQRRLVVPHDFKERFPNISLNELQECRQVAVAMWQSYLELGGEPPLKSRGYKPHKLPRYVFNRRFKIVYTPKSEVKHWVELQDSLDSAQREGRLHDKLMIPLNPSSYHLNRLKEGRVTSLRFFKDSRRKWWVVFSVRVETAQKDSSHKPPAVLGIDLGINKAVCSVLLTQTRLRHVRYFTQPEKAKRIKKYDDLVSTLQREMDTHLNNGQPADGVVRKLRSLRGRRLRISVDHDRVLVKRLTDHIIELSEKYDLYVAIGKLTHIRRKAGRDSKKPKAFRALMARWSFARISDGLKHSLTRHGWKVKGRDSRFIPVLEYWTSKTCHKCGHIGIRPKQSLFICHTCGYRDNADKNGAINIARRLIKLIPRLRDETNGLGGWLLPREKERYPPKTWRSSRSKGKSSSSSKLSASRGRSVVECHIQAALESFDDTTDPAMEKTVETSSATIDAQKASDSSGNSVQRTEAQSAKRSEAPMNSDEACDEGPGAALVPVGDDCHGKGGTRKSKVLEGVHSPFLDS